MHEPVEMESMMTTLKDQSGKYYTSPDNKPAAYGTQVNILNGNGTTTKATMVNGFAVPNKT